MTTLFNRFEQSELPSNSVSNLSPLHVESFNQVPNTSKRSDADQTDLAMGDIWSAVTGAERADRPTTQPQDSSPHPRVERLPDVPNSSQSPTEGPSLETYKRLGFGAPELSDAKLGSYQEIKAITSDVLNGREHAESEAALFIKLWRGPDIPSMKAPQVIESDPTITPPKDGEDPNKYTHVNNDQSSYTVTSGRISDFRTAATVDQPDGVTFSNIKYDKGGSVESYSNSLGETYTRTSPQSMRGLASWEATNTETGLPLIHDKFSRWNVEVDTNGIHILVGERPNYMISRNLDGSQALTQLKFDKRNSLMITGLETVTTLPDNTKVRGLSHLRSHGGHFSVQPPAYGVDVLTADGKYFPNFRIVR